MVAQHTLANWSSHSLLVDFTLGQLVGSSSCVLDVLLQAFCARIMFDPAAAAEATQGAVGAASGSSSRRKQGQAAPPQGYPLRVEGNRVFLEGLR